jgi:hypothetical protein
MSAALFIRRMFWHIYIILGEILVRKLQIYFYSNGGTNLIYHSLYDRAKIMVCFPLLWQLWGQNYQSMTSLISPTPMCANLAPFLIFSDYGWRWHAAVTHPWSMQTEWFAPLFVIGPTVPPVFINWGPVMQIVAIRNHLWNFTLCCSRMVTFLLLQLHMRDKHADWVGHLQQIEVFLETQQKLLTVVWCGDVSGLVKWEICKLASLVIVTRDFTG